MYYYLLLGSNISPKNNLARTIEEILINFKEAITFSPVYTKPENMETRNVFMNTIMIIQSQLDKRTIKKKLESIEETLGRNRRDPERSLKDRTCDIDILKCSNKLDINILTSIQDAYIQKVIRGNSSVEVRIFETPLSKGPRKLSYNISTEKLEVSNSELSI